MRGKRLARWVDRMLLDRWVSRVSNAAFLVGAVAAVVRLLSGFDVLTVVAIVLMVVGLTLHGVQFVRRRLIAASSDDPSFAQRYSEWVRAKRAALPDWPGGEGLHGGLATESPVYQVYNQTRSEVQRQARVEYHERFRTGVLALLGDEPEHVSDPRTLKDFEGIEELLSRRVGEATEPLPDVGWGRPLRKGRYRR